MALREALRIAPPPEALVTEFKVLGQRLVECAENGEECSELLLELKTRTGGLEYDWAYFADFGGGDSLEDFAERAALGSAPFVPDLKSEELVEVVQLICDGAGDAMSRYYLDLFKRNVTHPAASDLIYRPSKYWPKGYEPTAAEIVEKATSPENVIRL